MNYTFCHINPTKTDWDTIESVSQSTVFHSREWADYLLKIGYPPYVCIIHRDGAVLGYFVGEIVRLGVTMITAPMEGIGTYTQGLALVVEVSENERVEIYSELAKWLFSTRQCSYFQVDDWSLRKDFSNWIPVSEFHSEVIESHGINYDVRPTLYVNLEKPIDELWSNLHYKSCKYSVNKANRLGLKVVKVEERDEIPEFCRVHYLQLQEVCANKGVKPKPSQTEDRMNAVCQALFPNRVLMIKVVGLDETGTEQIMSSGIFCYDKGESIYWTGASYKKYQKYCPNELMVWEAMKMLHEKGAGDLNFGGMASYKLKFGTKYAYVPRLIFYKYRSVFVLKNFAKNCYWWIRNSMAKLNKKRS